MTAAKMSEQSQDTLLEALTDDPGSADLAPADRAIVGYAIKLTLKPHTMTADDVRALRDVGLDDRAIHDVCAITAYFNFVNRMADGLGVELEG